MTRTRRQSSLAPIREPGWLQEALSNAMTELRSDFHREIQIYMKKVLQEVVHNGDVTQVTSATSSPRDTSPLSETTETKTRVTVQGEEPNPELTAIEIIENKIKELQKQNELLQSQCNTRTVEQDGVQSRQSPLIELHQEQDQIESHSNVRSSGNSSRASSRASFIRRFIHSKRTSTNYRDGGIKIGIEIGFSQRDTIRYAKRCARSGSQW